MRIPISFSIVFCTLLLAVLPLAASGADLTPAQAVFWKAFKEAAGSNKSEKLIPVACLDGLAPGEARMATQVYLRQVLDGARSHIDPRYSFRSVDPDMKTLLASMAQRGVYPTMVPTQVFWIEGSRGGAPTRIMLGEKGGKLLIVCFTPEGVKARTYKNEYRHKEGLDPLPRGVQPY